MPRLAARALLILLLVADGVSAEPCTLYKAGDVANARENVNRHPWAQRIVESWKRAVRLVMEKDQRFIDAMISDLTPWPTYGQNCPVCVGKKSSMGECGIYRWNIADPDKLICKYCDTVYPNPDYPETGKLVCPRMGQAFTYYETEAERANPGDRSGKHAFRWASWPVHTSFSGLIRTYKAGYVVGKVLPLAKLYAVTGDVAYAQRATAILKRFAEVYPGYLFHSYNGTYADWPPADVAVELGKNPRGGKFPPEVIVNAFGLHRSKEHAALCNGFWGAGRFDCSGGDGSTILDMTVAYDLIREARLPDGSRVMDEATERAIVDDVLLAGCRDSANWEEINNKCGPGRALSAAIGVLFQQPERARWALAGFEQLMEQCFHFDGCCVESPSYSSMHLGLMGEIPEILRGYSDPPAYKAADGTRIDDLRPFEKIGRYRLALESMVRVLAPDRGYPVIGDTHCRARLSPGWAEILADRYGPQYAGLLEEVQGKKLTEAGSEYALWYRHPDLTAGGDAALPLRTEWFPGWHVAVLRGGDPQGDRAFYLNGYARHGHRHADTLGIIYYANGVELASDRGYIWDDPRNAWTSSTLAHNIVVVDGENQNVPERKSRLELFGSGPGIEVVEASASAYRQCHRYQRTCALVRRPDGGTYAVDFFRVQGGKVHQNCFHSNGALVRSSAPATQPTAADHRWLTNFRAAESTVPFTATWQTGETRLDWTLLSPVDRLIVADAPGWRSDAGSELNAPPIQQILAERSDPGGAAVSQYAAVMVPYTGEASPLESVRLIANDPQTGAIAVEVKLGRHTDTILSTLDQDRHQAGAVELDGRFGFVSVADGGKVERAYLLAGTRLAYGDAEMVLPAAETVVKTASALDRTFRLAEPLIDPSQTAGRYLLAGDSGYEIESATADSITVRDYPAIECAEIRILGAASIDAAGKKP
ncbi:MAG: hypothetical protein GXY83_42025 [Rhodopirellula sp.]|nr:hypothetical protein [Rhodopirellula sp.]